MAFWSSSADVEMVSRVVTAALRNHRRVRGKLTLHFAEPQTQGDADEAADRCAALTEAVLGEADDHEQLIGAEAELSASLRARLPPDVPPIRTIDLAALHVVGDPATSAALRRASTSTLRATPSTGPISVPPSPASFRAWSGPPSTAPPSTPAMSRGSQIPPLPSSTGRGSQVPPLSTPAPTVRTPIPPPPTNAAGSSGFMQAPSSKTMPSGSVGAGPASRTNPPSRRSSVSRLRAFGPGLLLAPGSPPDAIGVALAPFVRDIAGRVLVGFLRAYDLVTLRGLALEEGSAEMLAALVPVSDAPLGGYEQSRTAELGRWQTAFGEGVFQRLRRESQVAAMYLAHMALAHASVPQNIALEVLQEAAPAAFAGDRGTVLEMGRYFPVVEDALVPTLCDNLVDIVGHGDATQLSAALAPLVLSVREEMDMAATIAKNATGL